MNLKSTLWNRRQRANVEADLVLNGVDQTITAPGDERYNFGTKDFSIGFFVDQLSVSPEAFFSLRNNSASGLIEFRINSTNQVRVFFDPTNGASGDISFSFPEVLETNVKRFYVVQRAGTLLEVYVNGLKLTPLSGAPLLATDEFNLDGLDVNIGSSTLTGVNALQARVSNFCVFYKQLTAEEIQWIFLNGGTLPQSLHQVCIAHYPLNQRSYFKADAGFVAKHPQFIVGDLVAFDTVEQYYHDKYKFLDIKGARLTDFTAPTNGATYSEGTDGDGDYVQFDAGTPMVNSQVLAIPNQDFWQANDPRVEEGDILIAKVKFKFMTALSRLVSGVSFIGGNLYQESVEGLSAITKTETYVSAAAGNLRTYSFLYNIANSVPVTSSTRIYDIEYYLIRKKPITNNHGKLVNFTDNEVGGGVASRALATSITDFYRKEQLNKLGYSNLLTDADFSAAANYQFYRYDKGAPMFSRTSDFTIVSVLRYTEQFGASFGVGGARNSWLGTGRLVLGNCLTTYYELLTQKIFAFDTGVKYYSYQFTKLQSFAQLPEPVMFIISNDAAAEELTLSIANIRTGEIETAPVFDTSADSWSSNNDLRVVSNAGRPIISDVVVADAKTDLVNLPALVAGDFSVLTSVFLHWRFDRTNNVLQVDDISGNARHGILNINDTTPTPATAPAGDAIIEKDSKIPELRKGLFIDALNFNQYVQLIDPFGGLPFDANGRYTIEIVFKLNGADWPTNGNIAQLFFFADDAITKNINAQAIKDANKAIDRRLSFGIASPNKSTILAKNSGVSFNPESIYVMTIAQDNQGLAFDGKYGFPGAGESRSTQLFINGHLIDNVSSSAATDIDFSIMGTVRSRFGYNPFVSAALNDFHGTIFSFRVWDEALEIKSILDLANNTLLKNPAPRDLESLKVDLRFDNPVDNGGNIEFYERITGQTWRAINYANLAAVQAALTDIDPER